MEEPAASASPLFNRHFYVFKPPRELVEIDKDLKVVTARIVKMIGSLS